MSETQLRAKHNDGGEAALTASVIRLSCRDWLMVGLVVGVAVYAIPAGWERVEAFTAGGDYRMSYELSHDYGQYERYCRWAAGQGKTLVIGDSVVWGQYVKPEETLTHYLNEGAGKERYINLGLDGVHPAALAGLMEYYGKAIRGQEVVVYLNLLWMSSPQADLQEEKELAFNHPRLVNQFWRRVPCYKAGLGERLGIVIERQAPWGQWVNHLQIAYFNNRSLPQWIVENPNSNPGRRLWKGPASGKGRERGEAAAWTKRGMKEQGFDWVELGTSRQWQAFKDLIKILQRRNNRVFIVVGPMNEYMMQGESRAVYQNRVKEVEDYLREQKLVYGVPGLLASELYADASHPLGAGYARLAKVIGSFFPSR